MNTRTIRLVNDADDFIAAIHVAEEGAGYGGTIDLNTLPGETRALFEAFEEAVNEQMFGLLDELCAKITALNFSAVFEDGSKCAISDLQVFPSTGEISFKAMNAKTLAKRSA
jgi:hypothetical protein